MSDDDLAADLLARLRQATRSSGASGRPTSAGPDERRPRRTRAPSADPQYSAAGPDERDPVAAARALDELLDGQGWRDRTTVAAALARWDEIAGPDIAAHVTAESFTDGVLTLRADSTAWATQLRLLLPSVRRRVDAALGQAVVHDIVVRGPAPPRQRGALRVRDGRGPRDTYG